MHRESGLIVEVPEAEALIGAFRARLDRNAEYGVPAHVTVLYPFVDPDAIDDAMLARVRSLFAPFGVFDFVLDRTSWFDDEVLWLGPADDRPFRALTAAARAEFPEYPPYGGAITDPIPHLTVGEGADLDKMREAETAIWPGLPIRGTARTVSLLVQGDDGHWSTRDRFPFSPTEGVRNSRDPVS